MQHAHRYVGAFLSLLLVTAVGAEDPCRSGLPPGLRPGPYAAVVSIGKERGQLHCYVCEAGDRPTAIIFARSTSEPLGKLAQQLDRALEKHKGVELRGWVTFLHQDQRSYDATVSAWAKKHGIRQLPLAVFEDTIGPPAYRLAQEADVTVLLAVKQKVVANFAFRASELNDAAIANVLRALPQIVEVKK